ncbi:MAG TPA: primosomal protein N' [Lentisphaeria bacterium]|nr:MAG: primosomal protein N' [Lentisphaerae bacterium GWF2_38_69]HBM15959.1 primosomal protein N' [Lentisphaeria bacterium]
MPKIARVLVNLSLNKHYEYLVPDSLSNDVKVGSKVIVPFRNRHIEGHIVSFSEQTFFSDKLKEISSLCYKSPVIPQNLLSLGDWIGSYYCCSKEQSLRALLPGAVRSGKISKKEAIHIYISDRDKAAEFLFRDKTKSEHQKAILKALIQRPDMLLSNLKKMTLVSDSAIKSLIDKKLIGKEKRYVGRDPFSVPITPDVEIPVLTDEQSKAVSVITDMQDKKIEAVTALLFGVTGSGKTEVYLRSIKEALDRGKDSIVLVPEIALTPQTTERFRARFGNMVSVLHSALSDGERYDEWMKIYEDKVKIVVGARSALFAPFRNLGLIIVDEEHENSYKQDEAPRYHARDVAVMRAHKEGAIAILGSATPSMESYYNAESGKYKLLRLEKRIDSRLMPKVITVDMRGDSGSGTNTMFSKVLVEAVYDRLSRNEQTIIFLNRRGFATHMMCPICGYSAKCQNCSVDYTYHKSKDYLSCHICGDVIEAYKNCPECKAPNIKYSGFGTEKIEEVAARIFPLARIARMDSDTMTHKKSYETVLSEFKKGKIDILIGTQMLAKGLDFPNVTLVGIINADMGLHIPDFRASERTFQLLTQVAGRAGRGEVSGEVFIQTYTPTHPSILFAVEHDYEKFYEYELPIREELRYPPKGRLAIIRFSSENEAKLLEQAEKFYVAIKSFKVDGLTVSPLVPAPVPRAKNKFRYLVMLRGSIKSSHRNLIRELICNQDKKNDVSIYADIDALNML